MQPRIASRQKDLEALVKYTEKGVSTVDDIGHVLSYLNPTNIVFGRSQTAVDQFESNQNAKVRNLERHDKALAAIAQKLGELSIRQLFTSTAKATFEREKAMAAGKQKEADLIALQEWGKHGDALMELAPKMYKDLHHRGDGDPRNDGAWQRLHRLGVIDKEMDRALEFGGNERQRREKALEILSKPLGSGPQADAVRKHALHTFDTDPSLRRMQESAGILARGLPDVQQLLAARMHGRKYHLFVDDLRNRTEPLQKALKHLERDAPEIQKRMDELKAIRGSADEKTQRAIDDRLKSMQGMLDMVKKSDGTKHILDTVMGKSRMDADTWSNRLTNEGPKFAAGLAAGVAAATLCVATCGSAAPFVAVAGAAVLGGAAGGMIGYEGAREVIHGLRNNFDPDVTSGRLKSGVIGRARRASPRAKSSASSTTRRR